MKRDVVDGRWADVSGDTETTIGEDLWAIPGLVDSHAHFGSDGHEFPNFHFGDFDGAINRAKAALSAGVTLAIDKGWSDTTVIEMIDAVPEEDRPAIEAAARVISTADGYYPDFGLKVDPNEIASSVAVEAVDGRGWVKLVGDWPRKGQGPVANFDFAQLHAAVLAAETAGARVAIHTMARDVPAMAVAAGVHSIEHGLFLTEGDLQALGSRSGIWVPTILRTEAIVADLGRESSGGRLLLEGLAGIKPLLPLAIEAGVFVLAGTDLVGSPADVADEALRMAEFGLSNAQVLAAVSHDGFRATNRESAFGVGTVADAVLFEEDPLSVLGVLRHPAVVIRKGNMT